jgi:hypothetical protein
MQVPYRLMLLPLAACLCQPVDAVAHGWLDGDASSAGGYTLPESRRLILLAYEVGGQPLTGQDPRIDSDAPQERTAEE